MLATLSAPLITPNYVADYELASVSDHVISAEFLAQQPEWAAQKSEEVVHLESQRRHIIAGAVVFVHGNSWLARSPKAQGLGASLSTWSLRASQSHIIANSQAAQLLFWGQPNELPKPQLLQLAFCEVLQCWEAVLFRS